MNKVSRLALGLLVTIGVLSSGAVSAACGDVSRASLQTAADAVTRGTSGTGGFGLNMWVTMVDESGVVCHVLNTIATADKDESSNSAWLGSRVISAQKANTANAFSLNGVSISSGALYAAVQPGGSLFGLQESNPVNATIAYTGNVKNFGSNKDPLKGKRIGGVNVFGGGIALYNGSGVKVGAIGVSGDTSCTDHAFAWKVRDALGLDTAQTNDFEKLNLATTFAALGDHPNCANDTNLVNAAAFGFQ